MSITTSKSGQNLLPMDLAENRTTAAGRASSTFNMLSRRFLGLLSSKFCKVIMCLCLAAITVAILLRFLPIHENVSDVHKTQILILTGTRQPNESNSSSDVSVFLEIKDRSSNQTFNTAIARKRRLIKREAIKLHSKSGLKKFDIPKAREIIMNHNEMCYPESTNEFCRNILKKLNVSIFDENEDSKTEIRKFRGTNFGHPGRFINSNENGMVGHYPGHRSMNFQLPTASDFNQDFSERDRSSLIYNAPNNGRSYPYVPTHHDPSDHQPKGDCLLSRLINQYNLGPNGPMNLDGFQGYQNQFNSYNRPSFPYIGPGFMNPPNNGHYNSYQPAWPSSPETAPSAIEHSLHPQDVRIRYSDSVSSPSGVPSPVRPESSFRFSSCDPSMRECTSGKIRCIEGSKWCNGIVDCSDVSDELNCTCKSRLTKFKLCDGYYDCPLGEDELGCFGCDEGSFSCDDTDPDAKVVCFTKDQRCNNVPDCPNHKDEFECNMLSPSLHEKTVFAISHSEGFLHRNFMGNWYPVCENPYMWAHDACRRETGLLLRPPFIQMVHIDPSFKVQYMNNMHGGPFQMSDSCFNNSAVYVTCHDLMCGTTVMTTSQMLREFQNNFSENRMFRRRKRDTNSTELTPASNKESINTQSPEHNEVDYLSDTKSDANLNNAEGKTENLFAQLNSEFDNGGNRTKRENYLSNGRGRRADARIVGGRASKPTAWPWMVAIFMDGSFECGGVIINKRWIVTAAHCTHAFWEHYYEVQVGMLRRFSFAPQEQNHKVTHVLVNQAYSKGIMQNDLALMRLAPVIQFSRWARPVCLPNQSVAGSNWMWGPPPGTMCTAVGWGATKESGPDPDHMREVELPIWNHCISTNDLFGNEICAGPVEGGKDSCQGDSGGPLLCRNPMNQHQWYMAGIVSHGHGCAHQGEPGVYTRVSLYVDWIHFHIGSKSLPTIKPKQDCPGFRCVSGTLKCIANKRRCDRIIDCLQGEDEMHCQYQRSSPDDDNISLLSMTTTNVQNETQVQSIKTGETTQITGNKNDNTTPESQEHDKNTKPVTNPTLHKNSGVSYRTIESTQTQQSSNFDKDTEDLITTTNRYENVSHVVLKVQVNKSADITTVASFIDEPDTDEDIETKVMKIDSKIAAAMSEPKFQIFNQPPVQKDFIEDHNKSSEEENNFDVRDLLNLNPIPTIFRNNEDSDSFTQETDIESSNENVTPNTFFSNDVKINLNSTNNVTKLTNLTFSSNQTESNSNTSFTSDNSNSDKKKKKLSENALVDEVSENPAHLIVDSQIKNQTGDQTVSPNDHHEDFTNGLDISETKELPHSINVKPLPIPQLPIKIETETNVSSLVFSTTPAPHTRTPDTQTADTSITVDQENGKIIPPHHTNVLKPVNVTRKPLRPSQFHCAKITQSIFSGLRCNHVADCEDGSDELECTCVDYLTTFYPDMLCDGVADCKNGEDEDDCYKCDEKHFHCMWSSKCVPNELVCDGKQHCPNGEDELDCYALTDGENVYLEFDKRPQLNFEGYLAVRHETTWQMLCMGTVDVASQEKAATHVCNYLGFSGYQNYKIRHLTRDDVHLRTSTRSISNKEQKNQRIQYIYRPGPESSDKVADERGSIIQNTLDLQSPCAPNVINTCVVLYVTCTPIRISNISSHQLVPTQSHFDPEAMKTTNEILNPRKEYMWPWAAKVYIEGEYRCTGVIIDYSWVMVSSSCLWDALLNKDYICVVLGSARHQITTDGVFVQIYEVDAKIDFYESHITLLHLKNRAHFSKMVHPITFPRQNMHRSDSTACVTFGVGLNNETVTIILKEIDDDCGENNKCFVRLNRGHSCNENKYSGRPWRGIVSCKAGDLGGWYPAASYVERLGECGFQGNITAFTLAHIRSSIVDTIESKGLKLPEYETPACAGVRCSRGKCVPLSRTCDKVSDCEDGLDEQASACAKKEKYCSMDLHNPECVCNSGQLKCRNGRCLDKQLFGNGLDDCGDNSDEPPRATCAMYLARVAPNRLCDGHLHCLDRSDEDPNFCKCFSIRTHQCDKSRTCVAVDLVCDGVPDCPHGEDESLCLGLGGPIGAPYGTGEVIERQFGVWYTKCYRKPNHTKAELERICRDLGFISGHAVLLRSNVRPLLNPHTKVEVEKFRDVVLNNHTTIQLRNLDRPMARGVVDAAETCYPVFIECL